MTNVAFKLYGLVATLYGLIGVLEILNTPHVYLQLPILLKSFAGIVFFIPFAISLSRLGLNADNFESFSEQSKIRWKVLAKTNRVASTVIPGIILQCGLMSIWVVVSFKPPFDLVLTYVASTTFSTWSGIWFLLVQEDAQVLLGKDDD